MSKKQTVRVGQIWRNIGTGVEQLVSTSGHAVFNCIDRWELVFDPRGEAPEPEAIPIDISKIKMGTPMIFSNPSSEIIPETIKGRLSKVFEKLLYADGVYNPYYCVEFDPDTWNVWFGGKCPLPEGVEVEVMFRSGVVTRESISVLAWKHDKAPSDIIAYKAMRLESGYCYPWEV